MRLIAHLAVPLLLLAACSPGGPASVSGEQVRAYLLEHPEVIEEALTKLQQKRQTAADSELRKLIEANRDKLERDPRDFVAGNPNGKVTIVEFFDYRCPYCKAARPEIDKLLAENKDVRYVLKEYPILSPASEAAAQAAIAAKAQGKYWPVHQALMAADTLDQAVIDRILTDSGVDVPKAQALATAPATTTQLEDVRSLARQTGVSGTPAFFVDGHMIAGWSPEEINQALAAARKG
jgi:protein-disulfide isomerase